MERFMELIMGVNLLSTVLRLLLAAVLGGIIGTERGRRGRAAGMRTHVLVCIGAALTSLVGLYAVSELGVDTDPLRVGAQVISGIGFLGGGMILIRGRVQITGLTTAAGLWTTAAIGLAVGIGFYEASLVAVLLVLATNTVLPRLEREQKPSRGMLYVEVTDEKAVPAFLEELKTTFEVDAIHVLTAKSGLAGHIGFELEVPLDCCHDSCEICKDLTALPYVLFAMEQAD